MCYLLTCQVCVSANLSNMLLHIISLALLTLARQSSALQHCSYIKSLNLFYQGNSN